MSERRKAKLLPPRPRHARLWVHKDQQKNQEQSNSGRTWDDVNIYIYTHTYMFPRLNGSKHETFQSSPEAYRLLAYVGSPRLVSLPHLC